MLLTTRVTFFGGKGGVGKTTISAAAALQSADAGCETLIVSTDPAHSLSDVFGEAFGDTRRRAAERLWALELDATSEVNRYMSTVRANMESITPPRLREEVDRQLEAAQFSPGAEEAAMFERVCRIVTEDVGKYTHIVVDTAPIGHTLRLMTMPELMSGWISGVISQRRKVNSLAEMWGRVAGTGNRESDPVMEALEERRSLFETARTVLTSAEESSFHFVVIAERMPIDETERSIAALDRAGIEVGGVIINRVDAERQPLLSECKGTFAGKVVAMIPEVEQGIRGIGDLRKVAQLMDTREHPIHE